MIYELGFCVLLKFISWLNAGSFWKHTFHPLLLIQASQEFKNRQILVVGWFTLHHLNFKTVEFKTNTNCVLNRIDSPKNVCLSIIGLFNWFGIRWSESDLAQKKDFCLRSSHFYFEIRLFVFFLFFLFPIVLRLFPIPD